MFTLYEIAFAATGIPHRIGLLFTHKSADFGAISVTKRSWAAPISKVESHISDRCSYFTGQLFESARTAIQYIVNSALVSRRLYVEPIFFS